MMQRFLAVVGLGLMLLSQSVAADQTVRVMGNGVVRAVPDVATITLGVVTDGAAATDALRRNSLQMQSILEKAKELGVVERNLRTAQLSLQPRFVRMPDGQAPKIDGYTATNTVTIRLHQIGRVGEVIDALAENGANRIEGIGFDVEDRASLLEQARIAAVRDAQSKAEVYASAAGITLGAIQTISEPIIGSGPQPFAMARAETAVNVPIAAGETVISAEIEIVYAIRPELPD